MSQAVLVCKIIRTVLWCACALSIAVCAVLFWAVMAKCSSAIQEAAAGAVFAVPMIGVYAFSRAVSEALLNVEEWLDER